MIHQIFPQKIYQTNINKDPQFHLDTLLEAQQTCDDTIPIDEGYDHSTYGYTSVSKRYWVDSNTYGKEHKNKNFEEIFSFINRSASDYLKKFNINLSNYDIALTNSFLNFGDGVGNSLHDHTGAFISYTYYFHLERNLPNLKFVDPIFNIWPWKMFYNENHLIDIKPRAGDCLIFPSYIKHGTNDIPKQNNYGRWFFNGDFHLFSDIIPNFPSLNVDQDSS